MIFWTSFIRKYLIKKPKLTINKIVFFHPEGNINNNPNLSGIVSLLCEKGWLVDIVSTQRNDIYQSVPCQNSNMILVNDYFAKNEFKKLCNYFNEKGIPTLFVGVDRGVIEASIFARYYGKRYGLLSYEIFYLSETNLGFKKPEIKASRALDFVIVQDPVRKDDLTRENRITTNNFFYVPVAPIGPSQALEVKPRYFHRRYGLDDDIKIALHIGSIARWSCCDKLLSTLSHWPDKWRLVLHNRYKIDDETMKFIKRYCSDRRKLIIADKPFDSIYEMSEYIQSADLGIAFYRGIYENASDGRNIQNIGMSSGKIAIYLQHGVPVAVYGNIEYEKIIRKEGLGMVIDKIEDFTPVAFDDNTIARCRGFFDNNLDLRLTLRPWLDFIEKYRS